MDERFIPLAAFVSRTGSLPVAAAPSAAPEASRTEPGAPLEVSHTTNEFAHADAAHELALMRLAAHEAFERAKDSLLTSLAEHVLGREFALAPAHIEALVARVVDASRELEPVSLALNAADMERVRTALPKRIDPSLEPGDFVVEVRDGSLESPLRFRLRAALDRARRAG